jgi:hypothetical protein
MKPTEPVRTDRVTGLHRTGLDGTGKGDLAETDGFEPSIQVFARMLP